MGTLILSGGGSQEQNAKAHEAFAKSLEQGKPLLYIPVAGDPERRPHEDSFRYIKRGLQPYGIFQIEMWTDLTGKSFEDIQAFAGIYISGGCSWKLLHLMRDSGFDRILLDFYRKGGSIFGQSAGAVIWGSRLPSDLSEEGLNLVEDCVVWCHYKHQDHEKISRLIDDASLPVLALEDGGAVVVQDGRREAVSGKGFEWHP